MELQTLPGLFISHGSPMLALDPEQVGPALHRLGTNLPIPKAIIVMSAHWESKALEVSISTRPETWHDFRGFPKELYEIRYSAPGEPALAEEILKLLADAHFVAHANSTRPRDHGVWMPLLHMYPDADIPVVEISLPSNLSAQEIYRIGQTLALYVTNKFYSLVREVLLIILQNYLGKATTLKFLNGLQLLEILSLISFPIKIMMEF